MSNFGKEQLLKHGWTEGKGLGKNEDGISQAIKLTLKFDHSGVGYKETLDVKPWWQTLYNNAAKNIKVESHENEVSLSVIDKNPNTLFKKTEKNKSQYTNFVKAASSNVGFLHPNETTFGKCTFKEATSERKEAVTNLIDTPSADTLYSCLDNLVYAACNKTKLNGKLERIAQQDKMLLGMLAPGCSTSSTSASSTSHCDMNALGFEMHNCQLREKYLSKREPTCLTDARKNAVSYAERLSKLAQRLNTCNLKEDDARSKLEAPINKRKRNQDCIIQIEPAEMEDIYFFKKKPKRPSLDLSLEVSKVGRNLQEQKSHYEQVEMGIKKLSIKQKTSSTCKTNKIKKPFGKQSRRRRSPCEEYLKLADMWKDIMETIELTEMKYINMYKVIKRRLDANKHLDLSSNIEKCVKEHRWIGIWLRKMYSSISRKKMDAVLKKQEKLEQKIVEIARKLEYKKKGTQTHLTPV